MAKERDDLLSPVNAEHVIEAYQEVYGERCWPGRMVTAEGADAVLWRCGFWVTPQVVMNVCGGSLGILEAAHQRHHSQAHRMECWSKVAFEGGETVAVCAGDHGLGQARINVVAEVAGLWKTAVREVHEEQHIEGTCRDCIAAAGRFDPERHMTGERRRRKAVELWLARLRNVKVCVCGRPCVVDAGHWELLGMREGVYEVCPSRVEDVADGLHHMRYLGPLEE